MITTFTFPTPYPTAISVTSLVRTDTNAPVSGTTGGSGANWTLTFTEPVDGLTYAYVLSVTFPDGAVAPMSGTIAGTPTTTTGIPTVVLDFNVLQSEVASITWTFYDSDGNAPDLVGHVLNFVAWTSDDGGETKTFWFRYTTLTGEITIGGTSGNVVTVALQSVDLATAPNLLNYNLNDQTTDPVGLAIGVLKVAPALMDVPES
jgi:hypothetical protein